MRNKYFYIALFLRFKRNNQEVWLWLYYQLRCFYSRGFFLSHFQHFPTAIVFYKSGLSIP